MVDGARENVKNKSRATEEEEQIENQNL
ncbi:uncharacterized protein G2W53_022229 [Senna tora]|uniref:Uncharacterized protein n=1 Tax=Senna tora TaxID=362788 RepID=A0A834TLK7_9FABA|nr:uncharacterized protein G2W53_022229 [Senna tora]